MRITKLKGDRERGSALLLVPVMVLILFLAAGLVVDSAIGFSTKRDLVEAAAAVANDTVSAINEGAAYDDGSVTLDEAMVRRRAQQAIEARQNNWGSGVTVVADVVTGDDGRPTIRVTATGTAHYLFAQMFPGRPSTATLSAIVTSSLREES